MIIDKVITKYSNETKVVTISQYFLTYYTTAWIRELVPIRHYQTLCSDFNQQSIKKFGRNPKSDRDWKDRKNIEISTKDRKTKKEKRSKDRSKIERLKKDRKTEERLKDRKKTEERLKD